MNKYRMIFSNLIDANSKSEAKRDTLKQIHNGYYNNLDGSPSLKIVSCVQVKNYVLNGKVIPYKV